MKDLYLSECTAHIKGNRTDLEKTVYLGYTNCCCGDCESDSCEGEDIVEISLNRKDIILIAKEMDLTHEELC